MNWFPSSKPIESARPGLRADSAVARRIVSAANRSPKTGHIVQPTARPARTREDMKRVEWMQVPNQRRDKLRELTREIISYREGSRPQQRAQREFNRLIAELVSRLFGIQCDEALAGRVEFKANFSFVKRPELEGGAL